MTSRPRVKPYPFRELPRLLHVQVELSRVFWRHLSPILDAAGAATEKGWQRLEDTLGGPVLLEAREPYLFPLLGAAARVLGGLAVELELLTPSVRRAVLAVDEALCDRLAPRLAPRGLLWFLRETLRPAPVRVVDFCLRDQVPTVLGERPDTRPGALALALDLSVETPVGAGWLRLLCGADLRLGMPPPPEGPALQRLWLRRERLAEVPATLRIEAGQGLLSAGEVAGLSPGDIVVLDRFGPRPVVGGPVFLGLGGGGYRARLDGEGVTLVSAFHLRGSPMPQNNPPNPHDGNEIGNPSARNEGGPGDDGPNGGSDRLLRELPVQVTCEIGQVTMTGREVLELRPGAVLPVGRPLAGPVDLTVAGRVIARGELVDVEGEIGVRVTEVVNL